MKVTMIAALAANRTIGTGRGIPWDLPRDREHFRQHTIGQALLLGRRTFEEMLGWFQEGHRPIVLTRDHAYRNPQATAIVHDVPAAIDAAAMVHKNQLVVCGGASVYQAALPYAHELVLTEIAAAIDGDAKFPVLVDSQWVETTRHHYPPDEENGYEMVIRTLVRQAASS